MIENIKKQALQDKVPIIQDEGLSFICDLIKANNIKSILELGTAVGYSAINFASIAGDIEIDTIERQEILYLQALENIKNTALDKQINCYHEDIEDFNTNKQYDLIFVDAAKSQYYKYVNQFCNNLKDDGLMVFDNMIFHNLIYDVDNISKKGLRKLVQKIIKFRDDIANDQRFICEFHDDVGDGILLLKKNQEQYQEFIDEEDAIYKTIFDAASLVEQEIVKPTIPDGNITEILDEVVEHDFKRIVKNDVLNMINDVCNIEDDYSSNKYLKLRKYYPNVSFALIKLIYDQNSQLNDRYKDYPTIIVMHRILFSNIQDLRNFINGIAIYKTNINVDEKQGIVDILIPLDNKQGSITKNILSFINIINNLSANYVGYSIIDPNTNEIISVKE